MNGRVAGKVAFISGAARGQGRAHAVRLAKEGADIIAFDVCGPVDAQGAPAASEADLAETVALVEKQDRRIVAAKADARDFDAVARVLADGVEPASRASRPAPRTRARRTGVPCWTPTSPPCGTPPAPRSRT
jgi:(+)-trans-carveol dehydrogenase